MIPDPDFILEQQHTHPVKLRQTSSSFLLFILRLRATKHLHKNMLRF